MWPFQVSVISLKYLEIPETLISSAPEVDYYLEAEFKFAQKNIMVSLHPVSKSRAAGKTKWL